MKKIGFLLISLILMIFISSCNKKIKTPNDLAEKFVKAQTEHSQVYAKWTFYVKGAISKDTFSTTIEAWAQRVSKDTNLHGNIMLKTQHGTVFYINGEGLEYDSANNILKVYPPIYAYYAVSGYGSQILDYYLNPDELKKLITDTSKKAIVFDTTINGEKITAVKLFLPDEGDFTQHQEVLLFDKDLNLIRIENKAYMIWGWHWQSINIKDIKFDFPKDLISNTLNKIKQQAKIDTIKEEEDDQEQFHLLQKGTLAPEIYGNIYQTGDTFLLSQQKAKVYVIDFWYQTCSPCMRAIPYLIDLYNRNKDKGLLVIGVNSIDNNPLRKPYLKKFIEHKKINYPIVLTVRDVDKSYKVPGYPTIYVLDQNKNVVFYEVGFDPEEKLHAVDSVVTKLLNQ